MPQGFSHEASGSVFPRPLTFILCCEGCFFRHTSLAYCAILKYVNNFILYLSLRNMALVPSLLTAFLINGKLAGWLERQECLVLASEDAVVCCLGRSLPFGQCLLTLPDTEVPVYKTFVEVTAFG